MRRMLTHFHTLIQAIAATPTLEIAQLPLFNEAELATLILSGETTELALAPQTLHQRFEQQVAQTPQAVALICGQQTLSPMRCSIAMQINWLTTYMPQGIGRGACVGVCMKHTPEIIVAVLGVIKAGAAYLPLDPSYPADRLNLC